MSTRIKTAHSCQIILNNRYNGVPPAPGTEMAQSLGLSHSSARSRGHLIVAVVQYDWTTVCCFDHNNADLIYGGEKLTVLAHLFFSPIKD